MSLPAICCGIAPSFWYTMLSKPGVRMRRPLKSSGVRICLRNQPPICAPVLPQGIAMALKPAYSSSISAWPPPCSTHALCWRGVRPKGTPVSNTSAGSLPM